VPLRSELTLSASRWKGLVFGWFALLQTNVVLFEIATEIPLTFYINNIFVTLALGLKGSDILLLSIELVKLKCNINL
jgi:hypothetical protein